MLGSLVSYWNNYELAPGCTPRTLRQAPWCRDAAALGKATAIPNCPKGGRMRLLAFALLAGLGLSSQALAEEFSLTIKDHRFEPAELQVPAGKAFTLTVTQRRMPRPRNSRATISTSRKSLPAARVGDQLEPLDPGRYDSSASITRTPPRARSSRNNPMLGALSSSFVRSSRPVSCRHRARGDARH